MESRPGEPTEHAHVVRAAGAARRKRIVLATIVVVFAVGVAGLAWFTTRVAAMREQRASGPNWAFPSRIFSDGVPFEVGSAMPEPYLLAELRARDYREAPGEPTAPGTFARVADGFDIVLRGLPDEPDPAGSGGPERVRIHLQAGRLIGVERGGRVPGAQPPDVAHPPRLEPVLVSMLFDRDRVWRTRVSLERVPRAVQDAIVASEDRRFYRHLGVDPRSTGRALVANLRHHAVMQGGSTITMQLARGLFLGNRRVLARKLVELPLAIGLEILLTKQQILEMYLNSVYFGQAEGFGVGGIAEAARWYFDVPVESLDVVQGATLAAMIPAPNVNNPFQRPAVVLERRNRVLQDLVEVHRLSEAEAASLAERPLGVRRGRLPIERYPSYSGYVRDFVNDRFSHHAATRSGLSIYSTMDLAWQAGAEDRLAAGLDAIDGGSRRRDPLEGAFVALEPGTSAVRAMVGGRSPEIGDFNRAYQARRQTGSAIKPIVYATAFMSSYGFTPATTVSDSAKTFGKGKWAWRPRNFDGSEHEQVTLAKALERSLNVATTNLVDLIGPGEVARMAEAFGLGRLKPVPSIGLGSNETSLLQLTNAFSVFEDRGMLRPPSPIRIVVDWSGRLVMKPSGEASAVIPEGIAALMTGLLENVVRFGVAFPLRATYGFDRTVGGKTGTTDDFRDAWFIGFTPEVVAGVWVGYDRPRSIGRQAAHTALPVWARIVGNMLAGFPVVSFAIDAELEWRDVDPWTGFLADSMCAGESIPFLPGTAPLAYCQHGLTMTDYGTENLDSLYVADSTWHDTPEPLGPPESREPTGPPEPDTLGEAPSDTSQSSAAPPHR